MRWFGLEEMRFRKAFLVAQLSSFRILVDLYSCCSFQKLVNFVQLPSQICRRNSSKHSFHILFITCLRGNADEEQKHGFAWNLPGLKLANV